MPNKPAFSFPLPLPPSSYPSTYKTLDKPGYFGVHAIGEVWAQILWVVPQGLIKKHGFTDDLFPPTPLADGSIPTGDFYRPLLRKEAPRPISTATRFSPVCNAIILTDQELTGDENFCTLWRGFSSKGLGPDTNIVLRTPWGGGVRTDDFEVPLATK
ncbi:putative metalloprotease [Mycena olivaceomarginata]|nr:putative metalloprotease [Mycena olivaceomarginata]